MDEREEPFWMSFGVAILLVAAMYLLVLAVAAWRLA